MNRFFRQLGISTNWPILVAVGVLTAIGCVSIAADTTASVKMQLIFLAIGAVGMFLFQAINYQEIGRYAWPFYLIALGLTVYTVLPGMPRHGFGSVPNIKGAQ